MTAHILKEEFKQLLSAQESISIQDTAIFEKGELQNYLVIKGKAFDSISGVSTEQKVLARDVRQLRELFDKQHKKIPTNDSVKLAIQLDQRVMQQMLNTARIQSWVLDTRPIAEQSPLTQLQKLIQELPRNHAF